MDNHPIQNYGRIAIAIVLAAIILGAADIGSSVARATVTSVSTENSTATSTVTDTLTQTTTPTQTLIPPSTPTTSSTTTATIIQTATPAATSSLMVDSINQNGGAIAGHYTILGGPVGSMVVAEGVTPVALEITVGQTYFLRPENNGSCTFSGWSDGATSDPRPFNATSAPVSLTAVYSCSNASPASPIVQSCTGYFPITGAVTQTVTQTSTSSQTATTAISTTTTTTTGPVTQAIQAISCKMSSSVRVGDLIIVKISDLPGVSLSDSMGNMFTMLEMDRASSTYYNLIYYATASSSGPDTLTIRGDGNYPSIMATELQGLHTISSFETANGHSSVPSVSAFTPASGSFVLAFVEPLGPPISVSTGTGYTMAAVYAVSNACEYGTVIGQTTSSFNLGASTDWEEVSLVLSQNQVNFANYLNLQLSLNTSTSSGAFTVSVITDEYNPLNSPINVTAADSWLVTLNGLNGAPCWVDDWPVAFGIASGHFTTSNVTSAKFLDLVNPSTTYNCPIYLGVFGSATSYSFQPTSDTATGYGCWANYQCVTETVTTGLTPSTWGAITGYWNQGGTFTSFAKGTYTVLAEDEWGHSTLAYFTIA